MQALNAIKFNLSKAPTLQKAVSIRVVQEAIKEFQAWFPDVRGVRNSVGHTAELLNSPKELKRNSLRDPLSAYGVVAPEGTIFLDNLINETFTTTTHNGAFVKFEMTNSSLDKLSNITAKAFSAISPGRLSH